MEGHESGRTRGKRDVEDNTDDKNCRMDDEEDWEAVDKRKHRSSKSRKYVDSEEVKDQDGGRRKVYGDKSEERRKSAGSSRAGSGEEDDYDMKRESRAKIPRKSMDDRLEKRSSDGYQDRDSENSRKRRDDGNEWESSKRSSSKSSVPDNSQSRPRSKVETSNNVDSGKPQEKDSRYPEDKDINKDKKDHGKYEQEKTPQQRKWDESDTGRKIEESSYADKSDPRSGRGSNHNKHGSSRESDLRNESGDGKSRPLGTTSEKSRSNNRDGRREDGERSKSRNRFDLQDEDNRITGVPGDSKSDPTRDEKQRRLRERSPGSVEDVEQYTHRNSYKAENDKSEKLKQQRDVAHGNRDDDSQERTVNLDEDAGPQNWERITRDERHSTRSRTPDRNGRSYREFGDPDRTLSDSDNDMNIVNKSKERDNEGYRDNRSSRGRDGAWNDNLREWEGTKDHWRRGQNRQDSKEGDFLGNSKEWDVHRREQGRLGSESFHGRPGYRKDNRIRSEGSRGSSSFRHDSSDSIEIRPNRNLDFGREESVSTIPGRKVEGDLQQDYTSVATDEEWSYQPEDRGKAGYAYVDDSQERYIDDGSPRDQNSGRDSLDSQSGKGRMQKGSMIISQQGVSNSGNLQSPFGSFNRNNQGPKGGRPVRGGRGRLTGRDPQRLGLPSPMMAPPFGPIGLPPGPMQPIGPNMAHSTAPPIGPGVFMPPFHGPLVWPGARGVDMNMLAVPPNLPPMPPGPAGPRFPPNMGSGPGNSMYFNQPVPVRGIPTSPSAPGFNAIGSIGREMPLDKVSSGWGPQRTNGPSGKAPSRGEQNDYSQNFVDTGMRPQNFIRELELTSVVEDYPKLRELIQRKDDIVSNSSSPPMYYKCDLHEHVLSPDFFGTKFDVILVDPPWEEYVHRAPGITDHLESWTVEEIMNLKIEAIADTPSFIFLWVGDGVGLEQGRQCLKKWGFRRCEDICWVKTNKKNATPSLRHDSHTLFQHSKEHCLMGIKGTVRRSTDGHIIHANIDTDIIIAEEPSDGSTKKPEDMYRIIEHFALGRRRLELFGEDHNIRSGWLTVGKGLSSSNFNAEAYVKNFADKDGKVWLGGGGRNPPPDAPHLVLTTPEIEALRPKSPPQKNQQQSGSIIPVGNSNNRRTSGNSPQNAINASLSGMNMDSSFSGPAILTPWTSSPMVGFRGPDGGLVGSDAFDGYGFNPFPTPGGGDHIDFDSHRTVNLL